VTIASSSASTTAQAPTRGPLHRRKARESWASVERLEYDRSKAGELVYSGDPPNGKWSSTPKDGRRRDARLVGCHDLPDVFAYYGYMNRRGRHLVSGNYENNEIDRIAKRISTAGSHRDVVLDRNMKVQEMPSRKRSNIRLHARSSTMSRTWIRLLCAMIYGLGDGLNNWYGPLSGRHA
jgi:hypothetical protein